MSASPSDNFSVNMFSQTNSGINADIPEPLEFIPINLDTVKMTIYE